MSEKKIFPRLGVNLDHVATLRQARGESYPCLEKACEVVLALGADQITIHLREDYRHIQPSDLQAVKAVTDRFQKPLNLEMGCDPVILDYCMDLNPEWVCLVPEKRQERTTEGGLNLIDQSQKQRVAQCMDIIRSQNQSKISLFVESQEEQLNEAVLLRADAVEIHTGAYAQSFNEGRDYQNFLNDFLNAAQLMKKHGISFHAGHGLTMKSLPPLLELGIFSEFNIGHWIVAESVFVGLPEVIGQLRQAISYYPIPR